MSKRNIVRYTMALMRAGVVEEPKWMAALRRTPPPPPPKPGKRPPRIVFPEDELIAAYYRKHPEARLEPIDLASFEPPTARRFAMRQLELIQSKGLTKRESYRVVESEFAAAKQAAAAAAGGVRQSMIEQIQAEEEAHLQAAMRQYAESHGPELVKQHARELWHSQGGGPRAPAVGGARPGTRPVAGGGPRAPMAGGARLGTGGARPPSRFRSPLQQQQQQQQQRQQQQQSKPTAPVVDKVAAAPS